MPKKRAGPGRDAGPRMINRTVAVIKPKQAFLDWLKSVPDWDLKLTLDDLRKEDCTTLLIPEFFSLDQAHRYVESLHTALFEVELDGWYRDRKLWPKRRNLALFRKWFDIELHSMVIDVAGVPLRREPL